MEKMKSSAQISLFLSSAKAYVEERGLLFVEREQSPSFLSDRGMIVEDLQRMILELTVHDCIDGPEPDRDPKYANSWTVAEFGPVHNGEKIYLKISVRMDKRRCKCLFVKLWSEKGATS